MMDLKTSKISAIVRNFAVNKSRYSEPRELHGLIAILKTSSRCMTQIYNDIQTGRYNRASIEVRSVAHLLSELIGNFSASCQTPQLVDLATSCIVDILRLVIPFNCTDEFAKDQMNRNSLLNVEKLLRNVFERIDAHLLTDTPIVLGMIQKYRNLLIEIREISKGFISDDAPMVEALLDTIYLNQSI